MSFGRGSIERFFYKKIHEFLPEGSTLLELGSGWTSGRLSQHYTVYSIEHDKSWVGRYNTNYLYVPMKDGWYSLPHLSKSLEGLKYDAILIDGPPAFMINLAYSRLGFLVNLDLFDTRGPLFFDDTERKGERVLAEQVALTLGRKLLMFPSQGKDSLKRRKGCAVVI